MSDFHNKPFDEETETKLKIYEDYLAEWLPVFLKAKKKYYRDIHIFDMFCGPGYDKCGKEGSPLIAARRISGYSADIVSAGLSVVLHFNDKSKKKVSDLQLALKKYPESKGLSYRLSSDDFDTAYTECQKVLHSPSTANLLFVDQTGISHVEPRRFLDIANCNATDFLFFTSSSIVNRFKEDPAITKRLGINPTEVENIAYSQIHRFLASHYKKLIPSGKEYYIAPFSLKKGGNIYGLIFGTSNLSGINKFLSVCWKISPMYGDSNYDIDDDRIDLRQPSLFEDHNKTTKVLNFEAEVLDCLKRQDFETNKDLLLYSLQNGFLGSHAKGALKVAFDKNLIKRVPRAMSFSSVYKNNSIYPIEYC